MTVAVVFAVAAATKLRAIPRFREELSDYKVLPSHLILPAAIAVPLVELGAAGATLNPPTRSVGSLALLLLLGTFTAAVVVSLRRGTRGIRCACFGTASQTLSWVVPLRNFLFSLGALGGLLASQGPAPGLTLASVIGALLCVVLASLLVETAQIYETTRSAQHE